MSWVIPPFARARFPEYYAYKFASGEFHHQYPTNRYDPRLTRAGRILRKLSVDEVAARVHKLGLKRRNEAARLVREDRDR